MGNILNVGAPKVVSMVIIQLTQNVLITKLKTNIKIEQIRIQYKKGSQKFHGNVITKENWGMRERPEENSWMLQ